MPHRRRSCQPQTRPTSSLNQPAVGTYSSLAHSSQLALRNVSAASTHRMADTDFTSSVEHHHVWLKANVGAGVCRQKSGGPPSLEDDILLGDLTVQILSQVLVARPFLVERQWTISSEFSSPVSCRGHYSSPTTLRSMVKTCSTLASCPPSDPPSSRRRTPLCTSKPRYSSATALHWSASPASCFAAPCPYPRSRVVAPAQ